MLTPEARWHIPLLPAVEKAVVYSFPNRYIDCFCALSVSSLEPQQARLRAGGRAVAPAKGGDDTGLVILLVSLSFSKIYTFFKMEKDVLT